MTLVVTCRGGVRVDIDLGEMRYSARDQNLVHVGADRLLVKPTVVPGEPLVLGTVTGSVEFMGYVEGVIYR